VDPKGSLTEDVVASQKGAEKALIGAYAVLDGQMDYVTGSPWTTASSNWVFGSIAGGMAHKGSTSNDQADINSFANMSVSPVNSYLNNKWKALYEGVTRANSTLSILKQADDVSEEDFAAMAAEARFLRGHYYFELKKMYGNVPWVPDTTENLKQPNMGDGSVDIWQKIEDDFTFAMDNLPDIQSDIGRANSWAAASYLAKTHVYQQDWEEAKTLFDDITTNGVTASGQAYGLADDFKDNFDAATEHNQEMIFSVEFAANVGTGNIDNGRQESMLAYPYNSPFRCCGFFQPTQDLTNSYKTNSSGLPMMDSYNDSPVKNDRGISSSQQFTPYSGNLDPRLDWTVGRRGVPYHDWGPFPGSRWVRSQNNGGPYHAKKHIYWQETQDQYADQSEWAPGSAINYAIIRYADVLLMAAEAEVELNNLGQAREYVNEVRGRVTDQEGWVDNELNRNYALDVVDSEEEMLALDATENQWVVRTDRNSTFVYLGGGENASPNDISYWQEYANPAQNYTISTYPAGSPTFASQNSAREAVHFERKIELALEGHRFFDLIRWGEAEEKLNDFYQYEGNELGYSDVAGGSFTPNKNEFYPIPQRQIDLSFQNGEATLQQNQGY
jgi:hypothetical protein